MIALLVTTIVTVRATLSSQRLVRVERRLQALNAAEAALAESIQKLRWDPWMTDARGELGRAQWSVDVSHDLSGVGWHLVTLDADARVVDQSRQIRVHVQVESSLILEEPGEVRLVDWKLLP
jgi:hypothetical protein